MAADIVDAREPGFVLEGKYRILSRLGSGGMGEVYLARHLHLDEKRVVKILRPELATDAKASRRFLREARIASQIKHPNVAILYDYSRLPDGSFFTVWEHVDGEDVGRRLRRDGPFPLPLAVELGIQALRGLNALHEVGVIHRDLSPDNLMITEAAMGRLLLKIIDLGLAKTLAPQAGLEITEAGVFLGKLRYCSPEQAGEGTEGGLDHRTDLYSLAAVLYEMICGLPPYEAEGAQGFLVQRLSEEPLPLVGRNPEVEVPEALDRAVRRSLARERGERHTDAKSFIEELSRAGIALRRGQGAVPGRPPGSARTATDAPGAGSGELSREEKAELLARIEKAGKKAEEAPRLLQRAHAALEAGQIPEARELCRRLEASHPGLSGLAKLRAELHRAEEDLGRSEKIRQAEAMLERYLKERRQRLASLALETLLELYPNHPRRSDYESWVKLLAQEEPQQRRAREVIAEGRSAIARGDFGAARALLTALEREAPAAAIAEGFRSEVAAAAEAARRSSDVEVHRERFEGFLERGELEAAEGELAALSSLEVPRLAVDLHRRRLEDARSRAAAAAARDDYERRYRSKVMEKDWPGAREVALEYDEALPDSSRPAEMFSEVSRLEEVAQKQQAIEQGLAHLEAFIAQGRSVEARTALHILLHLAPDHPRRRELERQVRAMVRE